MENFGIVPVLLGIFSVLGISLVVSYFINKKSLKNVDEISQKIYKNDFY